MSANGLLGLLQWAAKIESSDEGAGQESMQTTAGQPILRYTEESKPKEESMPNCLNY